MAGDINLVFSVNGIQGDWEFQNGDIGYGQDLQTAIGLRLWTWRRAEDGYVSNSYLDSSFGHWTDSNAYRGRPLGSRLYELYRAKKTAQTLLLAQQFAVESCQDLVAAGIIKTVTANATWIYPNFLGLTVTVTEPTGNTITRNDNWAWNTPIVSNTDQPVAGLPRASAIISPPTVYYPPILGLFILGETILGDGSASVSTPPTTPSSAVLGNLILGQSILGTD